LASIGYYSFNAFRSFAPKTIGNEATGVKLNPQKVYDNIATLSLILGNVLFLYSTITKLDSWESLVALANSVAIEVTSTTTHTKLRLKYLVIIILKDH